MSVEEVRDDWRERMVERNRRDREESGPDLPDVPLCWKCGRGPYRYQYGTMFADQHVDKVHVPCPDCGVLFLGERGVKGHKALMRRYRHSCVPPPVRPDLVASH